MTPQLRALMNAVVGPGAMATLERVHCRPSDAPVDSAAEPSAARSDGPWIPRAQIAEALTLALFADLVERVPEARRRLDELGAKGARVCFDHGAMRTVDPIVANELPPGVAAFSRILEPLGYRRARSYPLTRLRMTGYAYTHADDPEHIAQFFISELHVSEFDTRFRDAVSRTLLATRDPLDDISRALLAECASRGCLHADDAARLLRALLPCFGPQHGFPRLADYEAMLEHSAEMAWISTEGSTFNHATERVSDVSRLADALRACGYPIKSRVEVSASGTIRQTALHAARVTRSFVADGGQLVRRVVPGSFYEFIQRATIVGADGRRVLDLGFDSSNAQGIFGMTAAREAPTCQSAS
jgi:hypothetical protein